MNIAAIIAEYNPFHNGHQYQIEAARRLGATHMVAVMGGNFLQRGTPALLPKQRRAEAALRGGADLVVELPLPYACATAQRFAFGGVSLLGAMGCIQTLCFGSESGSLTELLQAAGAADDPKVTALLPGLLGQGITFAKARQQAVEQVYGARVAGLFAQPNNILGIEYLRQLEAGGWAIAPQTVKRQGVGHDSHSPRGRYASASLLRNLLRQGRTEELGDFMPPASAAALHHALAQGLAPAQPARLEVGILSALRGMTRQQLAALPDISEGLENRLYQAVRSGRTLEEVLTLCKTKRYPLARLRRVVLSAYLGIEKNMSHLPPPYIRVLGFNKQGGQVLTQIKQNCALPVSSSLARLEQEGGYCRALARLEASSTDLYVLALPQPQPCGLDYTTPVVKV